MTGKPRASSIAAFVLAGLLAAGRLPAQRISNPELYGKSLDAAHKALEQYGAWDDPAARRRVNDIGYRLAVMSDYDKFPFTFYVVEMAEPNAFALPGGQVFVTRGMLGLELDDDMLACLLGHELAHVIFEHGVRMQRRARLLNLLSTAAMLGVMIGASDEPENPYDPYGRSPSRKASLVQGTAAAGVVLSELLLRDYSRDFEDEADVEGQRLAAAAGFDPEGARRLWERMNARIPPSKTYGYWRTHPFSDQRLRAAEVRAGELKILTGKPAEDYRAKTQQVILDWGEHQTKFPELELFVEASALTAWPQGPRAETLRLAELHRRRDAELEEAEVSRDYGELVRAYVVQIEEVRALTPETPFLATLETEVEELRHGAEEVYPKAVAVWEDGIFQTPFLETFLSNYPTAEQVPQVALALGDAYSRLGRQTDAVTQYLRASEAGPESEAAQKALRGLRNLAPHLQKLAALQQLVDAATDPTLTELASQRLAQLAPTYEELANGGEYLTRFPEAEHVDVVRERLEKLAMNLYGEVVLYQGVGDHVKALQRIQEILTHAPTSQAAALLRERAEVES